MTTVTISEARQNLPALVDLIQAGEHVTITRHGTPAAALSRPHRSLVQITQRDWDEFVAALDRPDTAAQAALRNHLPRWNVSR